MGGAATPGGVTGTVPPPLTVGDWAKRLPAANMKKIKTIHPANFLELFILFLLPVLDFYND
jgi:hypothetical protein